MAALGVGSEVGGLLGTRYALFLDLVLASWMGSFMVCALLCHALGMAKLSSGFCIPTRKSANICSVLIFTHSST